MKLTTEVKHLSIMAIDHKSYRYLLVISSDGLYIMSPERDRITETIVCGEDNNAWLCGTDDLDEFLDAISDIKHLISIGFNPLAFILPAICLPV